MDHIKLEPCTKVGRARKKRRRGKSLACILTWTFFDGRERRGVSLKASWRYTSYGIVFSLMRPQWQKMPHGSRTFFRRKEEEKISDSIGNPRALSTPFYELSLSAVLKKSPITNDFFFSLFGGNETWVLRSRVDRHPCKKKKIRNGRVISKHHAASELK